MRNCNKHLFGGALVAAGVAGVFVTQPAGAYWTFAVGYGSAAVIAGNYDGGAVNVSEFGDPGDGEVFDPISADTLGFEAYAFASNTVIRFGMDHIPSGFWNSHQVSVFLFIVAQGDQTMRINWDFSSLGAGNASLLEVDDRTTNIEQFFVDATGPLSGSINIALQDGHRYFVQGLAFDTQPNLSSVFARFSMVPAPGAWAIIGIAQVFKSRRRARNFQRAGGRDRA